MKIIDQLNRQMTDWGKNPASVTPALEMLCAILEERLKELQSKHRDEA